MGRKGAIKKGNNGAQRHVSLTLREESSGKKQCSVPAQTMCKVDHLKSLAVWAATKASVPSLGAFFGERLAATTEALEIHGDPSLFVCERCESVLQPGHNCTIRIEKNQSKKCPRRKKSNLTTQNNVVYTCHFCSHRNLMRGTPKGYMKNICPPKTKPPPKLQPAKSVSEKPASSTTPLAPIPTISYPHTATIPAATIHSPTATVSLLDSKRKKRTRSSSKKEPEPRTISTEIDAEKSLGTSKRRKRTWTSLKEVAQSNEHDTSKKMLNNLTIPFFL